MEPESLLVALDATTFGRRCLIVVVTLAGGLFLAARTSSCAGDDSRTFQRFAIVASGDIQATGLGDLLTAKLSVIEGMELVEREQLAAAIKEQQLSAYLGLSAVSQRLKLGKALQADVLVLLSTARLETDVDSVTTRSTAADSRSTGVRHHTTKHPAEAEKRFVRLVISDCIYGARLHIGYFPLDPDRLDELASECASVVRATRQRFAAGIEHLIGVTHFLSRNLTHDYDHLQAGFAALLENSLRAFPGVAAIEIEEARAIAHELSLRGGELKRPAVPVLVQGEFKMAGTDGHATAATLSVRLTAANRPGQQFEYADLSVSQVVALLTGDLPRQILQLSSRPSAAGFARPQLKSLLTARADAFSRVGSYEDATALREAALLVDPNDLQQRIRLIREYDLWQLACSRRNVATMLASNRERVFGGQAEDEQMWAKTHSERMSRFHMTVPHIQYLIDRRQVNPREASEVVSGAVRAMTQAALYRESDYAREDKQALEDFFWRIYPLFPHLDYALRDGTLHDALRSGSYGDGSRSAERQYQEWTQFAVEMIVQLVPRCTAIGRPETDCDHSRTLEHLFRFLTEIPHHKLPILAMARVTMQLMNHLLAEGRLSEKDVRSFFVRLKETNQPLNTFYARCGLLALNAYGPRSLESGLQNELDDLLDFVTRIEAGGPDARNVAFVYRRQLERLRTVIAQENESASQERLPLPENPIPPIDPSPPVTFTPTGIASPWVGWIRCDDSLDLMWSFDGVDVMTADGTVRRVYQMDAKQWGFTVDNMVYSAHWDGQNIWIATMKSGVLVVSLAGKILAPVHQQQGLPPYDAKQLPLHLYKGLAGVMSCMAPLRLQPVAPGKCLAAGCFGPHRRLWFAMISKGNDGEYGVHVFHEATRMVKQPTEADLADPTVVFPLRWTALYSDPTNPDRRWWLFARTVGQLAAERPALAIDLDTCNVTLFPPRFPPAYSGLWPRLQVGRSLLLSSATKIVVMTPSGKGDPPRDWVAKTILRHSGSPPGQRQPIVFSHDGVVYNPGHYWCRTRGHDFTLEVINDVPLALEHRFQFYATPAHYGIVAWNRGDQLYQVSFDRPEKMDLASRYPFIPVTRRERHHRAVLAIRSLGGSVGTQWGVAPHQFQRPEKPRWRTLAYLPAEWSGGDEGLAYLDDLYNLNELYLVQADISDEGLRDIGQLKDLESLHLVATKASNSGIAHLQSLSKLTYCRLQSTPDAGKLGDVALEHLDSLPRLIVLALVGRGFTDAGLTHLQNRRTVRELLLHGTSITPAGIAALKKRKPWLRISERIPN